MPWSERKTEEDDHKNYQELAVKICEIACADYIDALIVRRKGYLSKKEVIKSLWKSVLKYGRKRYVYRSKNGSIVRTTEKWNQYMLGIITNQITGEERIRKAEAEIATLENYFRSGLFQLSMPNTDATALMRLLKARARRGERMSTGYPSIYN